ncbi:MAG: hypothetical protein V2B20_20375 [Pseudomonadota bacterium]
MGRLGGLGDALFQLEGDGCGGIVGDKDLLLGEMLFEAAGGFDGLTTYSPSSSLTARLWPASEGELPFYLPLMVILASPGSVTMRSIPLSAWAEIGSNRAAPVIRVRAPRQVWRNSSFMVICSFCLGKVGWQRKMMH